MDLSLNSNISKDFRKLIGKVQKWRKNKNPSISIPTTEKSKPFKKVKTNEVWGKPTSFVMKKNDS
jgi:hypothetical protein